MLRKFSFLRRVLVAIVVFAMCIPSFAMAEALPTSNIIVNETLPVKTIYQQSEIVDIDTLYERARAGICDAEPIGYGATATIKSNSTCSQQEVPVYTTNQLLKRELSADGVMIDTVAQTNIAIIPASVTPEGSTSTSDETYDSSSRCVKLYSTVYYKKGSNGPGVGVLMYKVTGGFTILDENSTVSNKRYVYECNGIDIDTEAYITSQRSSGSISSMSMSKSTGFSKYINTVATHTIRYEISCTVNRAGSSWSAELVNGK